MFSALSTCYLFLGGAGGGALVILSALELANVMSLRGSQLPVDRALLVRGAVRQVAVGTRVPFVPRDVLAHAWPICAVLLAAGAFCLLVDAGRPDRLMALVLSPTFSVVAIGAWALAAAVIIACVFAALSLFEVGRFSVVAVCVLAAAGAVAGCEVSVYTGILLSEMVSVLAWGTPLLPVLFALSSVSCGVSVVLIGLLFANTRQPFDRALVVLLRLDGVLIVLEAMTVTAFVVWLWTGEATRLAAEALLFGELAWQFWGGVVLLGLVVPFALELGSRPQSWQLQIVWAVPAVLAGAFMLRCCVVGMAAYDVTQMPMELWGLALS